MEPAFRARAVEQIAHIRLPWPLLKWAGYEAVEQAPIHHHRDAVVGDERVELLEAVLLEEVRLEVVRAQESVVV